MKNTKRALPTTQSDTNNYAHPSGNSLENQKTTYNPDAGTLVNRCKKCKSMLSARDTHSVSPISSISSIEESTTSSASENEKVRDNFSDICITQPEFETPESLSPTLNPAELQSILDNNKSTNSYQNLNPKYDYGQDGRWSKKVSPGIQSWGDLIEITKMISQQNNNNSFELNINQHQMPNLYPTQNILKQLKNNLQPGQELRLIIHTKLHLVPIPYSIHSNGIKTGEEVENNFWNTPSGESILEKFHTQYPEHAKLFESLTAAHDELSESSMGSWLDNAIRHLDTHELNPETAIMYNKKTRVFKYIAQYLKDFSSFSQAQLSSNNSNSCDSNKNGFSDTHTLSPLSKLCLAHPPTINAKNSLLSIGAGGTCSLLGLSRNLIDTGKLSLDFALLAVNPNLAADEIATTGTRKNVFNSAELNPDNTKPIAVFSTSLLREIISLHRPKILMLNVKVDILDKVLDTDLLNWMKSNNYSPICATPGKSYDKNGDIPYLTLQEKIGLVSKEMAENLIVISGFYSAPDVLKGDKISIVLASQSYSAAKTLARRFVGDVAKTQTTSCNSVNLEIVTGQSRAAATMTAGANKNWLTFLAAHEITKVLLENKIPLQAKLDLLKKTKQHNVTVGENFTKTLITLHNNKTLQLGNMRPQLLPTSPKDLKTPVGVQDDYYKCLPVNLNGLHLVISEFEQILQSETKNFSENFKSLIDKVRGSDPSFSSLGTRNSRDGIMTALIHAAYTIYSKPRSLTTNNSDSPQTSEKLSLAEFNKEFYPASWISSPQEGRNGIRNLNLKDHIAQQDSKSTENKNSGSRSPENKALGNKETGSLELPEEIFRAYRLYNPQEEEVLKNFEFFSIKYPAHLKL